MALFTDYHEWILVLRLEPRASCIYIARWHLDVECWLTKEDDARCADDAGDYRL